MRSFSIRYLWIEIRTQSDTSFCTLLEVHFVIQKYYFHHLNFIQSFRPSLLSKVDLRTPKEEGFLKSLCLTKRSYLMMCERVKEGVKVPETPAKFVRIFVAAL